MRENEAPFTSDFEVLVLVDQFHHNVVQFETAHNKRLIQAVGVYGF
jgi:hypothetical protein